MHRTRDKIRIVALFIYALANTITCGCGDPHPDRIRKVALMLRETDGISVVTSWDSQGNYMEGVYEDTRNEDTSVDRIKSITIDSNCEASFQTHGRLFASVENVEIIVLYVDRPSDYSRSLQLLGLVRGVETLVIGFGPKASGSFDFDLINDLSGLKNLTMTVVPEKTPPIPNLPGIEWLTLARSSINENWLRQSLQNNPQITGVQLLDSQISSPIHKMFKSEFPALVLVIQESSVNEIESEY